MSEVYPFRVLLFAPNVATPFRGGIVTLSELGFLAQLSGTTNWQTGDRLQAQFDLPRTSVSFDESVKVIKAYTKWGKDTTTGESVKLQIFEMHFLSLATPKKHAIEQFVDAFKSSGDESS